MYLQCDSTCTYDFIEDDDFGMYEPLFYSCTCFGYEFTCACFFDTARCEAVWRICYECDFCKDLKKCNDLYLIYGDVPLFLASKLIKRKYLVMIYPPISRSDNYDLSDTENKLNN